MAVCSLAHLLVCSSTICFQPARFFHSSPVCLLICLLVHLLICSSAHLHVSMFARLLFYHGLFICSSTHLHVSMFARLLFYSFIGLLICSFVHLLICLSACLLIRSFVVCSSACLFVLYGAQTKRPYTKRPRGQNVPRT